MCQFNYEFLFDKNMPRVIDLHGHLGDWFNFSIPPHDNDTIIAAMDRCGIGRMIVSHLTAITGEFPFGNEQALAAVTRYPTRLLAYLGLNPHYPEDCLSQLEQHWGNPSVAGIKLHPQNQGYSPLDSSCEPILNFANQHGCLVLSHIWGAQEVWDSRKLALKYPNVTILMGHCGGPNAYREAVNAAAGIPNLFLDLTSSYMMEGMLEWMVEQLGAQQIVFGSDMPFYDAKHAIGRIVYSRLSRAEQELILWGNAAEILEKAGVNV